MGNVMVLQDHHVTLVVVSPGSVLGSGSHTCQGPQGDCRHPPLQLVPLQKSEPAGWPCIFHTALLFLNVPVDVGPRPACARAASLSSPRQLFAFHLQPLRAALSLLRLLSSACFVFALGVYQQRLFPASLGMS